MRSARDLVESRRSPTTLDRSVDPTKRMTPSAKITNNPMDHTTYILSNGMQAEFRNDPPKIDWGR
jgi:hypothetical protein